MTKLEIKGFWNQLKGKLKQHIADLTNNDWLFVNGKEDELIGRLQKRIGKKKEKVKLILSKL
jgi:uncharacterized protein YjbJ (UPF0337 family)